MANRKEQKPNVVIKASELMRVLFSKKSNLSKNKIIRPQKLQLANPAINKGRKHKETNY